MKEKITDFGGSLYEEVKKFSNFPFGEIPPSLAARIENEFSSVLLDPEIVNLTGDERRERDRVRGYSHASNYWDHATPAHRLAIARQVDQKNELQRRYSIQEVDKEVEGRYTVNEAASRVRAETGSDVKYQLTIAAKEMVIKMYAPGSHVPNEYRLGNETATFRPFYEECYWDDLNAWLEQNCPRIAYRFPAPAKTAEVVVKANNHEPKLWEIFREGDPDPEQAWYTPARYFARQLVAENTTLLEKRNVLAEKTANALFKMGYRKRGNKKGHQPGTVLKALSNIVFD